jgi:hypothetical protein
LKPASAFPLAISLRMIEARAMTSAQTATKIRERRRICLPVACGLK